ncbi:phospholipid methyltransferase-domain-containing protein [Stachybotrys elegans]|uniref:Phosphatidylethanolamine N-methyltransferase n=1 Tax=Stachybotrys elegans TaxID=80388 RepID=A0A8K0WWL2_9HYPO|nr:phospholipid methyltransferase-domain-containing protein [Stachybotrys elegans]
MAEATEAASDGLRQRIATGEKSTSGHERPESPDVRDSRDFEGDKKTYGRTPDGTVFVVPTTHDMVSELFTPKCMSDYILIFILAMHIIVAYLLPSAWKRPVFAAVFLFWRASYNVGIGFLLNIQSNHRRLVKWAHRSKIFESPEAGGKQWVYDLVKKELEAKVDYKFDEAPIEYNTWLLFRKFVDIVLLSDFTAYCLFAIICMHTPEGEGILAGIGRWLLGIVLFGFNVWVKLDAHRVVKDFAWYWGDFFFLVDQNLTFDGVFEVAPHPMYSIGYVGYYGISMLAASYEVLFISIIAHLSQFTFLVTVESPHIEKTYNPPPPRRKIDARSNSEQSLAIGSDTETRAEPQSAFSSPKDAPLQVHNLVGFSNMDLFRVTDCAVVLMPLYVATLTLMTPSNTLWQALFVAHALAWRVWYHFGLAIILNMQSKTKMWTRHFLKFGETAGEAWRQWKGLYHVSMIMCNTSLVAACWKVYSFPEDWSNGLAILKHVIGAGLIALQIWTSLSVYESLGEFGWFCGDFFFDREGKLNYTSIYRFLNNPERVFGIAGVWGAALITWSRSIFIIALVTQILTLYYVARVEQPHMKKIYGLEVRPEAGVTKFIKRSLPAPVKGWQESIDKVLDDTGHIVEEILETARPKFESGVKTIVHDTSALFNMAPARLTITRISPDLEGLNQKNYSLAVEGTPCTDSLQGEPSSRKSRSSKQVKTMAYEYGSPIRVKWRAPVKHSKHDWIGLYMVTDNRSREVTETSSLGRWIPTNLESWDSSSFEGSVVVPEHRVPKANPADVDSVGGEVVFKGDKLWWSQGVFEFRYHHNNNHTVMAVSEPFEICVSKFPDDDLELDTRGDYENAVEAALLPVVQNCMDQDPDIAPGDVEESFGGAVERDSKYAKRVVYAIREMFGIEFAPAVVLADGNIKRLAWRIRNAKEVLAPYSLSSSRGTTTPVTTMS